MNLKVKLLFIFSISAFTALSFFGYVAYDTASHESGKNETLALQEVFSHETNQFIEGFRQGTDVKELLAQLNKYKSVTFILFDKQHKLVYEPAHKHFAFKEALNKLPFGPGMGTIPMEENELHWFTTPIPDTKFTLATFYFHSAEQNQSFLSQMALTLVFTAFIVLWFAAWSAMYIGSLIEKLNAQKVELEKLATHDCLTGLPNRSLLTDRLEQNIL
ncbi:MAG: GGDEF domain-containing protein, partial [Gammaproteobacteria bacterium]|nr:GGDEF domain-containing protein [Gammaproteobacteria bacterium]